MGHDGSDLLQRMSSGTMHIDAHQHFWSYSPSEHVWMTDEYADLRHDFGPADLGPLLQPSHIDGTIAIQARQNLAETEWLLGLAERHSFIKGVVGWVDLCSTEVESQLARYARNPVLKGVRHVLHDEPDDRFMLRGDFRSGISLLDRFELTYDLLLFPRHLPYAVELVSEFPRQRFVLDHLGKPGVADRNMEPWLTGIRNLARFPNVCCKLSGMLTLARWHAWSRDEFRPYLDRLLDAFGADRLMIGSDWPVCTLSGSFEESIGVARDFAISLPDGDAEKILGGTACVFYGLQ